MTILYLLLLVLALLISGFAWSEKLKKLNPPLSWLFLYIFSVLIGFRDKFSGVDTKAYFNYYNDTKYRITPDFTFEPGFTYLTQLLTEIVNVEVYIFILSFIQLLCMYLAAKLLNINNKLLAVVIFLSFVPGFDMLTNGIRGGVALTTGLFLLVLTVINKNRLAIINFIPAFLHASYAIVALIGLFVKSLAGPRMNIFIFTCSLFFFLLWLAVNPLSLLAVFEDISKQVSYLGRLIRYLIIEKELMSLTVKLYFIILSILFSCIYFITLRYNKLSREDEILTRMAFIALSIQFIYALFSFSQYSYRFMFLAFPLQILMFCYIMDKYYSGVMRQLIVFSVCFLGILSTYSTKTFSSFKLLSL